MSRPVPRRAISWEFAEAIRRSGHSQSTLAALSGFYSNTQISALVSVRVVRVSSLNVERLQRLATVVGHDGELFA